jgi:hypothetical protein
LGTCPRRVSAAAYAVCTNNFAVSGEQHPHGDVEAERLRLFGQRVPVEMERVEDHAWTLADALGRHRRIRVLSVADGRRHLVEDQRALRRQRHEHTRLHGETHQRGQVLGAQHRVDLADEHGLKTLQLLVAIAHRSLLRLGCGSDEGAGGQRGQNDELVGHHQNSSTGTATHGWTTPS